LDRAFNASPLYFITFCTHQRRPFLACDEVHAAFAVFAKRGETSFNVAVGRYVIMPDHMHFFCSPRRDNVLLERWVQFWKSRASQRWPRPEEYPIWLEGEWDTQMRQGESYASKWEYVVNNPVRAGLAKHSDDWPYQGELNVLRW
jgi:putative transposase